MIIVSFEIISLYVITLIDLHELLLIAIQD